MRSAALAMKIVVGTMLVATALTNVAHADSGVEVSNEVTGAHCPGVTVQDHAVSQGCDMLMTSEAPVELEGDHTIWGFHIHEADCDNRMRLTIDEAGQGYISDFQVTNCTSDVEPCDEPDGHEKPWAISMEEIGPGTLEASIDMCVIASSLGTCDGAFDVKITETNETYEVVADGQGVGSSICEFDGHWLLEESSPSTTDVHFTHL